MGLRRVIFLVGLVSGHVAAMETLRFSRLRSQMQGDSDILKGIAKKLGGQGEAGGGQQGEGVETPTPTSGQDIEALSKATSPSKDAEKLENIARRMHGLSANDATALRIVASKLKADPDCEKKPDEKENGDAHLIKNIADRLMQLAVKSRSSGNVEAETKPVWQKVKEIEEKKRREKNEAETKPVWQKVKEIEEKKRR